MACSVIGAVLFYFIINKLFLQIKGLKLLSYQGINEMGKATAGEFIQRIFFAYKRFFKHLDVYEFNMYPDNTIVMYYLLMAVCSILSGKLLWDQLQKDSLKALFLMLLFLLIPLAVNFIFVMTNWYTVHALMVYAQIMPYVYLCWLLENVNMPKPRIKSAIGTACCLLLILLNVMFCRFDNKCYLKASLAQQEAISYFTTLITQIKSTEGYDDDYPVVYINDALQEDNALHSPDELNDILLAPYRDVTKYVNTSSWEIFMKLWCGFEPRKANPKTFSDLPEVQEMPSYPDSGSIRVIHETVVVKF